MVLLLCYVFHTSVLASEDNQLSAIEVLEELGAVNPIVFYDANDYLQNDNLVKNPETIVVFNGNSYAFLDDNNNIVRIKRVDEIRKLKKNSTEVSSKFNTVDDLIIFLEKNLIGYGYELSNRYYFSEDTISLRYEKILSQGVLDRYDYISIRINENYKQLESYYRNSSGYCFDQSKQIIPEEEAVKCVKPLFDEKKEQISDVRLTTFKTKEYYDSNVETNMICLAYIVSSEESVIYVDAYDANILGKDEYKVIRGGSIGSNDVSTASASANLAKNALLSMGYTNTPKVMSDEFGIDVPPILKSAFYCCCHGNATCIGSNKTPNNSDRYFHCSSVPLATYKFVFLDACNTASSNWKTAFNISNSSTNKAFLGWTSTVAGYACYDFCIDFWSYVSSTYTIYEAAADAADVDFDKPIQFTGDTSYNGYY